MVVFERFLIVRQFCGNTRICFAAPEAQSGGGFYDCGANNPCTNDDDIVAGGVYFPHQDPAKYVRCTIPTTCYLQDCPSGLIFYTSTNNCDWP